MQKMEELDAVNTGLMQDSTDIEREMTGHPGHDLPDIAAEIRTLKRRTMDNILQIGTLLMKAKEQLFRHGQWLHWLQYNVDISVRNAERYMQLAKAYSNSTLVSDLTTTKALQLLKIPDEEREAFIREPHMVSVSRGNETKSISVAEMTTSECRQAIRAWQKSNTDQKPYTFKPMHRPKPGSTQDFIKEMTSINKHLDIIEKFLKCGIEDSTFREACVEKLIPLHDRVQKLFLSAQKETE